jgi:hypothetical protein
MQINRSATKLIGHTNKSVRNKTDCPYSIGLDLVILIGAIFCTKLRVSGPTFSLIHRLRLASTPPRLVLVCS